MRGLFFRKVSLVTAIILAMLLLSACPTPVDPAELKSSNAALASLVVSDGFSLSPVFVGNVTDYVVSLNVPYSVTHLTVTAVASDAVNATVTNSGVPQALAVGANTLVVGVTAHDGVTARNYTLTVYRLGPDGSSATISDQKYIPAGRFRRDSTAGNVSIITRPFLMSQHEVTRSQFAALMVTDPSLAGQSGGTDDPVQQVSWFHAVAYANKLSELEELTPVYSVSGISDWTALSYTDIPRATHTTGTEAAWLALAADWDADGYRLPTEMEWLWAAMGAPVNGQGGSVNADGWEKLFAGSDGDAVAGDYAWYNANADGSTQAAGGKLANELGLYDLSGNVAEWVWDRGDWVSGYPAGSLTDYRGAVSGDERIIRGGAFTSPATDGAFAMDDLRLRSRDNRTPDNWNPSWGFRLVRLAP